MMKDTDEAHKLTESIYRSLSENFTPGVRQIILAGKVYHKALVGVASAARTYNEVLLRVGQTARTTCKGGTEDIGEAIYQMAEAHKEIQSRIEENTKALYSELILPLEQKLENDFKRSMAQHKKYTQGHKTVVSPYIKAHDNLKKFRKKTKNKVVYDDQKENQYMKSLEKCQEKLTDYRLQGLKLALLEDRKCHCFLLDRLSTLTNLYANHHKQSADILLTGLPEWRRLSSRPQILPPETERLLYQLKEENDNGSMYWGNGHIPSDTRSLGSPYRRSNSAHDMYRRPMSEYASPDGGYNTGNFGAKTMPHSRGITVPPAAPPGGIQVRAVYSHVGEGDQKLSFTEGDLLNVIGEQADGWQYGLNTRSGQYGWFPLSFTEPCVAPPREPAPVMNGRVKSVGDLLDSRSLSEHADFYMDDVPGRTSRPKSMYEGSNLRLVNGTNQPYGEWVDYAPVHPGYFSLPRQPADGRHYRSDYSFQALPPLSQLQQGSTNIGHASKSPSLPAPPPAPPLPQATPPAPPPPQAASSAPPPPQAASSAPVNFTTSLATIFSANRMPSSPAHSVSRTPALSRRPSLRSSNNSVPQAPPIPPAPPLPGTKSSVNSQNGSAYNSRQQQSQPPPVPPPPPPGTAPPKMSPPTPPAADYNTDEDREKYKKNPKFAGVQLRKTETRDRSAPRI